MKNILILGGDSDHNIGDTAILVSLCHSITRARPGAQVTVLANNPEVIRRLPPNVTALPRGAAGIAKVLSVARRQDLILVGGGGLFQDDDSRIKMPYWAARIALLRALNPNVVGHALGAGPLQHPESRKFARFACNTLRSVSVRDAFAQAWLERCTGGAVAVVPDPAFMLPPAPAAAARDLIRSTGLDPDRPIIGVALRRWFHQLGGFVPHRVRAAAGMDRQHGEGEMCMMTITVADTLRTIAKRMDASVLLMPSYNVRHEGDIRECERLKRHMPAVESRIASIPDPATYKAVAGQLKLMVSARMHPLILAAGMGVPIAGLAYNGKFEGLFGMLGLQRKVLWLEEFRQGNRVAQMERLINEALEDKTDLRHRSELLSQKVHRRTRDLLAESAAA